MGNGRTTRYAVNLDGDTDARFQRLIAHLAASVGRQPSHRGQRFPTRADALKALLTIADTDEQFRAAVVEQVRANLTNGETS